MLILMTIATRARPEVHSDSTAEGRTLDKLLTLRAVGNQANTVCLWIDSAKDAPYPTGDWTSRNRRSRNRRSRSLVTKARARW
jgi:hypothetical protein